MNKPTGSRFHRRLNSSVWKRLRRRVLDAVNWRCAMCGQYGNEVDHIQPLHLGGAEYDLANLQVLCTGCHIRKTAGENRARQTDTEREAWRDMLCEIVNP